MGKKKSEDASRLQGTATPNNKQTQPIPKASQDPEARADSLPPEEFGRVSYPRPGEVVIETSWAEVCNRLGPKEARELQSQIAEEFNRALGPDRGNSTLLKNADGEWLRVVNSGLAKRYTGIGARGLHKAVRKGKIDTEGDRNQKRFLVESLRRYVPPEK
jgi:hypothetical protein